VATVQVHVSLGGQPVVGASVSVGFYGPGPAAFCNTRTDSSGDASCSYTVPSDAPDGSKVDATVTAQWKDQEVSAAATFTVRS
jgi:hypothetical protein